MEVINKINGHVCGVLLLNHEILGCPSFGNLDKPEYAWDMEQDRMGWISWSS